MTDLEIERRTQTLIWRSLLSPIRTLNIIACRRYARMNLEVDITYLSSYQLYFHRTPLWTRMSAQKAFEFSSTRPFPLAFNGSKTVVAT